MYFYNKTINMKKLRIIVTSVIVLAIVGSALAFNAKRIAVICYSTLNTATCDATFLKQIVPTGGTLFLYYSGWRGLLSDCTAAGNQNCTTLARIAAD